MIDIAGEDSRKWASKKDGGIREECFCFLLEDFSMLCNFGKLLKCFGVFLFEVLLVEVFFKSVFLDNHLLSASLEALQAIFHNFLK